MEYKSRLNLIYFFFDDNFDRWALKNKLESFVDINKDTAIYGITFPVSLLTLFSNPRRFIRNLLCPGKKVRERVYSLTPFGIFPIQLVNKSRFLIVIHQWLFKAQINAFLDVMKVSADRITWVYNLMAFPVFFDIVKGSRLSVYQCEDEDTMREDSVLWDMKAIEDRFLSKTDVIFTLSRNVYETRKARNKNCYLVPNGVDFDFFRKVDSREIRVHPDLENIQKPIVGYLGHTRTWLDFELIEYLVDRMPDVSFVFVGPVEKNVKKNVAFLKMKPNVYFIGRKDHGEIPSVLKAFDVCTIPFKYNQFNLATNPLKFWEYLATGRPILTLRIPDFEPYKDMLYMYRDKDEALEGLRAALNESGFALKQRRMKIAAENSLSLRSKQYYDILMRHLDEKNRTNPK